MCKKTLMKLLVLIAIVCVPSLVGAAPEVAAVSGTLTKGSSVTITGSDLGTKTTAAPLKYDFFDQTGEAYDDGDPLANGWGIQDSDGGGVYRPRYSTTSPRTGSTKQARCDYTYGTIWSSQFWYDWGGTIDEVYVTAWMKGTWSGANHVKFFRLVNNLIQYGEGMNPDWLFLITPESIYDNARDEDSSPIHASTWWSTGSVPDTTWIRIEFWLKKSTHESPPYDIDGHVWANVQDGFPALFTEIRDEDVKTNKDGGTDTWRYINFCEYAKRDSGDVIFEWDDIYIDNTRARVEIGNNTTWANCTHREIQIPTAWSNTSITITANQGSFANGEDVYLFVVDADGLPSAGYGPITIGSEGKGDDTTPPGDVTDLTKQVGDGLVVLEWTNPTDSDFKGTMIRYRTDGIYPANNSDGIEVCNKTTLPGASDTYTLTGLSNGTTYYFSAFTYDEDGNYSNAAHISAMPSANVYTKTFGDISGSDFPGTCQDTYIKNDINYSDDSEAIRTYTWPTNSAANRIVMKWDLSTLPQDTIIQEATLSLYMYDFEGTGGDDNYEITAHKIINHNPDISSCTWNTYDGSNSWTGGANGGEQDIASAESSTIIDKTSGYKNWAITQMVQEWVDNSSTNFGLMLNSDTTAASDSNRYFRPSENSYQDQRPVLIIKYFGFDIPKVPSAPTGLGVIVSE